ncbi:hypothetical protein ACFPRL_02535 [Pseudoclavibacter helvolus]
MMAPDAPNTTSATARPGTESSPPASTSRISPKKREKTRSPRPIAPMMMKTVMSVRAPWWRCVRRSLPPPGL